MSSPKMEVKCTVDTCHYYQNERCHASALEVNPMDNCVDNCMVQTSQETICNTFKPSESNFT